MKGQYNKSEIMKRAWRIFRGDNAWSGVWSESLKRAWEIAKANIAFVAQQIREQLEAERIKNMQSSHPYELIPAEAYRAYYTESPRGTYFGD